MKRIFLLILALGVISHPTPGQADIYRFEGDNDVVSFTDAPQDRRYLLVVKESRPRSVKPVSGRSLSLLKKEQIVAAIPSRRLGGISGTLPIQGVITSPAGMRHDPFDGRLKHHNGLDIAAPTGTPVKPVAPGTVIFSGWKSGYGNTVILEHNDGMVTVYAHHANNSVSEGATVDTSSVIARSGSTGRSTGPHLHFEAWLGGDNITREFMPQGTTGQRSKTALDAPIRRYLQEDGTILFTNLR